MQVLYVNKAIKAAKKGEPLHGAVLKEDPSDDIIRVHLAVEEYNMQSRKFGSTAEDLVKLQGLAEDLLNFCKMYLTNKVVKKEAGSLKNHKVSCTKCVKSSCLDGLRISVYKV